MTAIRDWLAFAGTRRGELLEQIGVHLELVLVSLGLATLIGVPLGMFAASRRTRRTPVMAAVGILQTIPSLALLSLALVVVGEIGVKPALIALTLYGLLPIVRGTVTGFDAVPPASLAAADALGMTRWQKRLRVELPLAIPNILAGVRTAAVIGVGVATLAAFVGGGGLGVFINRGLSLSDSRLVLLGAIPAALLAIAVDGSLAALSWGLQPVRESDRTKWSGRLRPVALSVPIVLLAASVWPIVVSPADDDAITIGSKKFGESLLLGEIVAQLIEDRTDIPVVRSFTLGGTLICHESLVSGALDMYPEYTGTALKTIVGGEASGDPAAVQRQIERGTDTHPGYNALGLRWMPPFGFENTYALAVRPEDADDNGWESIIDLVPDAGRLTAGFESEFNGRADGYPALRKQLGLTFGTVADMEASLMYQSLADGQVDVISAYSTDGRLDTFGLLALDDSTSFFPPYDAAMVVREQTLQRHPELVAIFDDLAGRLDAETMRKLNGRIDQDGDDPAAVAREWLQAAGLVDQSTVARRSTTDARRAASGSAQSVHRGHSPPFQTSSSKPDSFASRLIGAGLRSETISMNDSYGVCTE